MGKRPHVAIVEDDPEQRESLTLWLTLKGYDVWAVESAEEFYSQMAVKPVDILIADLGLPGEDGVQMIHKLRQQARHGIIITSARSSIKDRLEGLGVGADHYLVKPVVPDELLLYIDALWQRIRESVHEGSWVLSCQRQVLQAPCGALIKMTPSEVLILSYLARQDAPVLKESLVVHLGADPNLVGLHRVDAHLSRLRIKLKKATKETLPIIAVPGLRLLLEAHITIK